MNKEIPELLLDTEEKLDRLYSAYYTRGANLPFGDFQNSLEQIAQGVGVQIKSLELTNLEIFFLERSYLNLISEFEGVYYESESDLLDPWSHGLTLWALGHYFPESYRRWYGENKETFLKMYKLKLLPKVGEYVSREEQFFYLEKNFKKCQPSWWSRIKKGLAPR